MIYNGTKNDYQLCVEVGDEYLEGEWRSDTSPEYKYEIVEKNHIMRGEYWGGFSRHNELYRRIYDQDDSFLFEELVTENHALMMYSPFISESTNNIGNYAK